MYVLWCVLFCPLCGLAKYTDVGTVLGPILTVGMLAIGPRDSQTLFSQGHWGRSTEVRYQDFSHHEPGPTMGAMEAAQTLVWPSRHMYMPKEPTAAKARPVPAARALVVLLDVLQVLNLGSHQQRCNSAVCAAMRRDFSSSS